MHIGTTNCRQLLQSLAALPAAALVMAPQTAMAAATKIITFNESVLVAGGKDNFFDMKGVVLVS